MWFWLNVVLIDQSVMFMRCFLGGGCVNTMSPGFGFTVEYMGFDLALSHIGMCTPQNISGLLHPMNSNTIYIEYRIIWLKKIHLRCSYPCPQLFHFPDAQPSLLGSVFLYNFSLFTPDHSEPRDLPVGISRSVLQ